MTTTITIIGASGFAGSAIVAEALRRGLRVGAFSRGGREPAPGLEVIAGNALNAAAVASAIEGSDIVIGALSPRGELQGRLAEAYVNVLEAAKPAGAQFIVVGGFSSLRESPGGPRYADGDGVPAEFADEAREVARLLPILEASGSDWLFVSPAADFGDDAPAVERGEYRLAGDVAAFDAEGRSMISAADFATGILDIALSGEHHREHLSLSY